MKFITLLSLITFSFLSIAQESEFSDTKAMIEASQNEASQYYFPNLLTRYLDDDTSLSNLDYAHLYFGNSVSDDFSPYGTLSNDKKFKKFYNKGKWEKAIVEGEKLLENSPFDLGLLFKLAVMTGELGHEVRSNEIIHKLRGFNLAIMESGDGETCETGFVITTVSDEYFILRIGQFDYTMQSLVGNCDKFDLQGENDLDLDEIFFDASIPLDHLSKLFGQ